ncbi:MAG: hypothetical protein RIG26_05515 [Thalassospira sp.]|uniref:hypothetical protein n=1 Tax=Thalassospira sp. TaxID=1912094 RepID=UPI0032EC4AF0
MTSNTEKREKLIYFCQHLFSESLLPTPSELITAYIHQGAPRVEKVRPLHSHSEIAKVWIDLVSNSKKTFKIDHNELRSRAKFIQGHIRSIHQITKNSDSIITLADKNTSTEISLSHLIRAAEGVENIETMHPNKIKFYKISMYFMLVFLCGEADIENQSIKDFWTKAGIDSTTERVHFAVKELHKLLHVGPFATMALMVISQMTGKYPRGLWFDCMHSVYLPYVDYFFTTDMHFQTLQHAIHEPALSQKLVFLKKDMIT